MTCRTKTFFETFFAIDASLSIVCKGQARFVPRLQLMEFAIDFIRIFAQVYVRVSECTCLYAELFQ